MNPAQTSPRKVALVSPGWTIWQHRLLSGALRYADAHPRILIRVFAPIEDMKQAVQGLHAWGAQGALGLLEYEDMKQLLQALKEPLPLANCALAQEAPNVVNVLGDFTAYAHTAVDHLRQLGLRSLALLVLEEGPQVREKQVAPFLREARPADPAKATLVFAANRELLWSPETPVTPIPKLLASWLEGLPKPVGVLCPNLGGGGYLIRCCRALGLRVPEDVAIVGSDDTDLSLASQPTVTSVLLSMETLGFEAMRLLAGMMSGEPPPAPTVRLRCLDLVVRESTGRRRPEICDIAGALDCIRTQATRGVTVEEVMRQTQNVSRVTFQRRFQAAVGKTPAEAIRDRKLEEVRRLLSGTDLPLQTVAALCGFSSPQVLSRLFRSTEGMSLRDFRARKAIKA